MSVPLPTPAAARRQAAPVPKVTGIPRTRRARLPDVFPAPSELRTAVAVAAEISADGSESEFGLSRAQVLRWLEAHVGPLPAGFDRGGRGPEGGFHVERHRSAGAIVRAVEREAGTSRYFGVSLEVGAIAGLAAWKAIVVLFRAGATSYLRAVLLAPRRRLQTRTASLWVPGIVPWLARSPGLTDYGWRVLPAPWVVEDEEGVEGLIELIGNRDRTRPVFAIGLYPRETNPESALLDPWDLAHRTVGLAHVVVLTGPMTYVLTDRVGRKYSVFGNAIRTYRPGCVLGSRAMEHPMALPETVRRWRNGGSHEFSVFLTREAARASVAHQKARQTWFPESLHAGGAAPIATAGDPDPFGEALFQPAPDGDALHPLGAGREAGEDAEEPRRARVPQTRAS